MSNLVTGPGQGKSIEIQGLGIVFKLSGADTGGAFAIVEHPLAVGVLAAPPHTHTHEDEISYILDGEVTLLIGEELIHAEPGAYVRKPRGIPHTFWNSGTTPARIQEIITPAGFEQYFAELSDLFGAAGIPDMQRIAALAERYGLTFHMERLPELATRYGAPVPEAMRRPPR